MNKQLRELIKTDDPCGTCQYKEQATFYEPCSSCSEICNGQESNYFLGEELEKAIEELEAKATKWDMIQWAIDNAVEFVEFEIDENTYHTCLIGIEIDNLKEMYDERGDEW